MATTPRTTSPAPVAVEPTEPSVEQPNPQTSAMSELAQALVAAVNQGNAGLVDALIKSQSANAAPRQKTIDEVSPTSPFNPRGLKNRDLPFPFYQNGVRLHEHMLHDEELALIPKLKSGTFVNGLVRVDVRDIGGGQKKVFLDHNGGTPDQRIALKSECRNLTEILKRCIDEAASTVAVAR